MKRVLANRLQTRSLKAGRVFSGLPLFNPYIWFVSNEKGHVTSLNLQYSTVMEKNSGDRRTVPHGSGLITGNLFLKCDTFYISYNDPRRVHQ